MSRIYWDTMLLIYILEGNASFRGRTEELLARSRRRGDALFTSCLTMGELVASAENSVDHAKMKMLFAAVEEMGFSLLPFDKGAVQTFGRLRGKHKLKVADSIHLACAASAGIDLFLTGDKQLLKIDVPGIQFIADFNTSIL
ncbi:MAG: type II toxin-antitoxin system VapC family toxin [Terracidiphilus sp.]